MAEEQPRNWCICGPGREKVYVNNVYAYDLTGAVWLLYGAKVEGVGRETLAAIVAGQGVSVSVSP